MRNRQVNSFWIFVSGIVFSVCTLTNLYANEHASEDSELEVGVEVDAQDETSNAPFVARSAFSLDIEDREPLSPVTMLDATISRVFFFTELRNLQNQIVTHRWYLDGEPVAELTFNVKGTRWRVFSSKTITPGHEGIWSVDVLDNEGRVILTETIKQVL